MEQTLLILVVALGFIFAYVNGFHDGCNVIATIVSSRSMEPRRALFYACLAEFIGPLIMGTAVAATVGKGVINPVCFDPAGRDISGLLLLAALSSAIIWNLLTWWLGLPSSSSHALIGGLVGGGIAAFGIGVVNWHDLFYKVILVLFISPVLGMVAGYVIIVINIALFKNAHPRINNTFKRVQLVSMVLLGASHGANDAQKSMGVITMMLLMGGTIQTFEVPFWVMLGSAAALSLGVSSGGWKIIKTVGTKIFRVEPIHSFSSQVAAGTVILVAGLVGGPVSTTQVVGSSIIGVGAGHRTTEVRWMVVKDILIAWLITIPGSGILAIFLYYSFMALLGRGGAPGGFLWM